MGPMAKLRNPFVLVPVGGAVLAAIVVVVVIFAGGVGGGGTAPTPTSAPTATPTRTFTPTATRTPTATATSIATPVPPPPTAGVLQRVGTDAVWNVMLDINLTAVHKCPTAGGSRDACVEQIMQSAGASEEAIAFFNSTELFLVDFRPMGKVDLGLTVDPWMANSNQQYVLLNGIPSPIYPGDELEKHALSMKLDLDPAYPALAAAFPPPPNYPGSEPNLSADSARGVFAWASTSPQGGQRFVFSFLVDNGCRACLTRYSLLVAFDFDSSGGYVGPTFLGLCRGQDAQTEVQGIATCSSLGP